MSGKPNFFIVGASRSGSTYLHSCLKQHPEIIFHSQKEPNFYNKDRNYYTGKEEYYNQFQPDNGQIKIFGDASVMYFESGFLFDREDRHYYNLEDDSAKRIKADTEHPKILITLRNPIDRIFSIYNKNLQQGRLKRSLREEIKDEINGVKTVETSRSCWVYQCRYAFHVKRWIEIFGRENVKVIIFEEWTKNEIDTLNEISLFLNIVKAAEFLDASRLTKNDRKYKSFSFKNLFSWSNEEIRTKKDILSSLYEDMTELELILNKDLSYWKTI